MVGCVVVVGCCLGVGVGGMSVCVCGARGGGVVAGLVRKITFEVLARHVCFVWCWVGSSRLYSWWVVVYGSVVALLGGLCGLEMA